MLSITLTLTKYQKIKIDGCQYVHNKGQLALVCIYTFLLQYRHG